MSKWKVPVQSLIDHIKTAVDVDPWAKEMAEELLKKQEPKSVESIQMDRSDTWGADLSGCCPSCKRPLKNRFNKQFCGECGQAVKWE